MRALYLHSLRMAQAMGALREEEPDGALLVEEHGCPDAPLAALRTFELDLQLSHGTAPAVSNACMQLGREKGVK